MLEFGFVKTKSLKLWDNHIIHRASLTNGIEFPLSIRLPTITSRQLSDNFSLVRGQIQKFIEECERYKLSIVYKEINHRQLGVQRVPVEVYFNGLKDYLSCIKKEQEYTVFCELTNYILIEQPNLREWLTENVNLVLANKDKWTVLLQVCKFFQNNPLPNKYIRELAIPMVDTKFIEHNKTVLSMLFNQLLPAESIINERALNRSYDFEVRYGLKYIESLIRYRILDKNLLSESWCGGISDFSVPLSQFAELNIPCRKIFITENKINGLSFPDIPGAIIIFGLGYGVESLKNVAWLMDKEILYWGDIDTHGFAILSQLRSYYRHTRSMLMDITTLNLYRELWGRESVATRCAAKLPNLTNDEQDLYQILLSNQLGECLRLEQERISYEYLLEYLFCHQGESWKSE